MITVITLQTENRANTFIIINVNDIIITIVFGLLLYINSDHTNIIKSQGRLSFLIIYL